MLAIGTPYIPSAIELQPFAAELSVIGGIVAVILGAMFNRRSNAWSGGIALFAVAVAFVLILAGGGQPHGVAFRGMLVSDSLAVYWKALVLLFTSGIIVMWFTTTRHTMHEGDAPEYFTLLLTATLGMCL